MIRAAPPGNLPLMQRIQFSKRNASTVQNEFRGQGTKMTDLTNNLVLRARDFAYAAHNAIEHRRKYTGEPYTTHLQRVAQLVESVDGDESMIAAAYLHDTVEDTSTTIEDIRSAFGDDVAYLVSYLTDISKPDDGNRKLRKKMDREHIAKGDARHLFNLAVSLADVSRNFSDRPNAVTGHHAP